MYVIELDLHIQVTQACKTILQYQGIEFRNSKYKIVEKIQKKKKFKL